MRNSSLLKWANNKNLKLGTKDKENGGKNWIHPSETLMQGHVSYLVKFLGSTEVDQPKGIDVVKQGIQKLKFAQQLRRSESGNGSGSAKTPKMELTISAEGVAIQDPKSKQLMHQYPLHKISYCADDKAEKRFFSFIAKEGEGKHTCFVFVSDKLAEEITLTIGQAFELAYKKFQETSGKEMENKKQMLTMHKRVQLLEQENKMLKQRLEDLDAALANTAELKAFLSSHKLKQLSEVAEPTSKDEGKQVEESDKENGDSNIKPSDELICLDSLVMVDSSNKLDNLTLDDLNDDDFNPRALEEAPTMEAPILPPSLRMKHAASEPAHLIDAKGTNNPFRKNDAFGMDNFHHAASNSDVKNINNNFNLNDLDHLVKF